MHESYKSVKETQTDKNDKMYPESLHMISNPNNHKTWKKVTYQICNQEHDTHHDTTQGFVVLHWQT